MAEFVLRASSGHQLFGMMVVWFEGKRLNMWSIIVLAATSTGNILSVAHIIQPLPFLAVTIYRGQKEWQKTRKAHLFFLCLALE